MRPAAGDVKHSGPMLMSILSILTFTVNFLQFQFTVNSYFLTGSDYKRVHLLAYILCIFIIVCLLHRPHKTKYGRNRCRVNARL